jgi:uncharacterized membrane protein
LIVFLMILVGAPCSGVYNAHQATQKTDKMEWFEIVMIATLWGMVGAIMTVAWISFWRFDDWSTDTWQAGMVFYLATAICYASLPSLYWYAYKTPWITWVGGLVVFMFSTVACVMSFLIDTGSLAAIFSTVFTFILLCGFVYLSMLACGCCGMRHPREFMEARVKKTELSGLTRSRDEQI